MFTDADLPKSARPAMARPLQHKNDRRWIDPPQGTANANKALPVKHKVADSGLEHIEEMRALQRLDVRNTQVTDAGVQRLQNELPNCTISHNRRR